VTFLLLGKARTARFDRLTLLDALLPVYGEVLSRLAVAGATWVQLDEPCLALDRTPAERAAFVRAYRFLAERVPKLKILVATYFAGLDDNLPTALELPVAGLHLDVVRAGGRFDALLQAWPAGAGVKGKCCRSVSSPDGTSGKQISRRCCASSRTPWSAPARPNCGWHRRARCSTCRSISTWRRDSTAN